MTDINELIRKLKEFHNARNWDQFHTPKDLVLAMVSEVGELAECYRWLSEKEVLNMHQDPNKKKKIEEEIADILMFLLTLSYKLDIDVFNAVSQKIEKNEKRYPVSTMKSKHTNPIVGFKNKD